MPNEPITQHNNTSEAMIEASKREKEYTNLVREIAKDSGTLHWLKIVYFWAILGILSFVCIGSIIVLINLSSKASIFREDIVIAISSLASLLSTIIVLPKIMAKHIFPENYEKERYTFVNLMQRVDRSNSKLPPLPTDFGNSVEPNIFDTEENAPNHKNQHSKK